MCKSGPGAVFLLVPQDGQSKVRSVASCEEVTLEIHAQLVNDAQEGFSLCDTAHNDAGPVRVHLGAFVVQKSRQIRIDIRRSDMIT